MVGVAETRGRFGNLAERLAPSLYRGDPAADAVVDELLRLPIDEQRRRVDVAMETGRADGALGALIEEASSVPPWVDWQRLDRAGRILFRAGLLGGMTLGLRCLVYGYVAPAGNKPLALSGALTKMADRRLAETGRFVKSACTEGEMHPGARGWTTTLKVRLMHARVRRLSQEHPRWDFGAWGTPINQHDMMATILLFSSVFVEGVRRLGVTVTPQEADDYQHLFRWVGRVIGVDDELLPATFDEAERLGAFIRMTQGPPDEDSQRLVDALIEGPLRAARTPEERRRAQRQVALSRSLCRSLTDDELADRLGLPRDGLRHVTRGVKATVSVLEGVRRRFPGVNEFVEGLGNRYWNFSVEQGLAGEPARFYLPERLFGEG